MKRGVIKHLQFSLHTHALWFLRINLRGCSLGRKKTKRTFKKRPKRVELDSSKKLLFCNNWPVLEIFCVNFKTNTLWLKNPKNHENHFKHLKIGYLEHQFKHLQVTILKHLNISNIKSSQPSGSSKFLGELKTFLTDMVVWRAICFLKNGQNM